jgi:hypothetical protein
LGPAFDCSRGPGGAKYAPSTDAAETGAPTDEAVRRVQEWMARADLQTTMKYLHYESRPEDAQLCEEQALVFELWPQYAAYIRAGISHECHNFGATETTAPLSVAPHYPDTAEDPTP